MREEKSKSIGICFSCGVRRQDNIDVMAWDTKARLDRTLVLFKMGIIDKIVCTGGVFQSGQQKAISELMKDYLFEKGISKESILIETQSVETVENIKFSLSLLKESGFFDKINNSEQLRLVLISEVNHLKRIDVIIQAYLKEYKLDELVPILLEPVYYHISDKTIHEEKASLEFTILDPLGTGEMFEKVRRERRQG